MSVADKRELLQTISDAQCASGFTVQQVGDKIALALQRGAITNQKLVETVAMRIGRTLDRQGNKKADYISSIGAKITNGLNDTQAEITSLLNSITDKLQAASPQESKQEQQGQQVNIDLGLVTKHLESLVAVIGKMVTVLEEIRNRIPYPEVGQVGDVDKYSNENSDSSFFSKIDESIPEIPVE